MRGMPCCLGCFPTVLGSCLLPALVRHVMGSITLCWRLRACTWACTDMSRLFQALKKAFSDSNFSWQRPDTDPSPADLLRGVPSDMRCTSFLSVI